MNYAHAVVADCEVTDGVRLTGYTDLRPLGPQYGAACDTVRGRMIMTKTFVINPDLPPTPDNLLGAADFQVYSVKMGRNAQTFVTLETVDGDLHITGIIQADGLMWVFLNRMPSVDLEVTVSWTVMPVGVMPPYVPDPPPSDGGGDGGSVAE